MGSDWGSGWLAARVTPIACRNSVTPSMRVVGWRRARCNAKGTVWSFVVDLGPDRAPPPSSPFRVRHEEGSRSGVAFVGDGFRRWDGRRARSHHGVWILDRVARDDATAHPRQTWVSYEMAATRITRQIGAVPLQALTPQQVESLYASLLAGGGTGGRPLAPKTVRNCHVVLRRALADAERLGLVSRNPAAAARAVAGPRAEQRPWSADEIQRFFEALAGSVSRWHSFCWRRRACVEARLSAFDGRTWTLRVERCRSFRH